MGWVRTYGGLTVKELRESIHSRGRAVRALPDLLDEVERLQFINDYFYEALGPANDEVAMMADEAWDARR